MWKGKLGTGSSVPLSSLTCVLMAGDLVSHYRKATRSAGLVELGEGEARPCEGKNLVKRSLIQHHLLTAQLGTGWERPGLETALRFQATPHQEASLLLNSVACGLRLGHLCLRQQLRSGIRGSATATLGRLPRSPLCCIILRCRE